MTFAAARMLVVLTLAFVALVGCEKPPPKAAAAGEIRIVALSPAVAIILKDLGREPQIVGRHQYDMVLSSTVPICGDQAGIDYESLLRVRPTHVVTQWGARTLPAPLLDMAKANNWKLYDASMLSLDDLPRVTAELAGFVSVDADVSRELTDAMRAAWSPQPGRFARAGRVLLVASTGPVAALGPGSWHQDILVRLGGTPALKHGQPWMELSAEDLLTTPVDAIVLVMPRSAGAVKTEDVAMTVGKSQGEADAPWKSRLGGLAKLDLPAVRNGRVLLIDDPLSLTPSTAMLDFTRRLETQLRAWDTTSP